MHAGRLSFIHSLPRKKKKKKEREHSAKRNGSTFSQTLHDAPLHTDQHSTSWRLDVPPPYLGGASHGWVPVNTHGTPVLTSVRRLWVVQPRPHAHASDTRRKTHRANTKCADHPNMIVEQGVFEHRDGWRLNSLAAEHVHPQHGSGTVLRVILNSARISHDRSIQSRVGPFKEDKLVPRSRRRVRNRIRDSDSEDVFIEDGERTTPCRRLVLVSSTQVDPVPPIVEEGPIYHSLTTPIL